MLSSDCLVGFAKITPANVTAALVRDTGGYIKYLRSLD